MGFSLQIIGVFTRKSCSAFVNEIFPLFERQTKIQPWHEWIRSKWAENCRFVDIAKAASNVILFLKKHTHAVKLTISSIKSTNKFALVHIWFNLCTHDTILTSFRRSLGIGWARHLNLPTKPTSNIEINGPIKCVQYTTHVYRTQQDENVDVSWWQLWDCFNLIY